jgi:DNA-binding MarR family transcriptional regulator
MHDFMRFARRWGLSMAQLNVLMRLYYHGGCEISGLLPLLEVSKAAAGQLVERMEQQGLVERAPAPHDRRARLVTLSAHGRELVEASIAARQAWLGRLVQSLPQDEQAEIARSLARLAAEAEKLDVIVED